jgi:WD40 repeat protein
LPQLSIVPVQLAIVLTCEHVCCHSGAVHALSIHPTGRLALSVGVDKTLRTWNLVKGRSAFITNLKEEAHLVRWSPDGSSYLIAFDTYIEVYATAVRLGVCFYSFILSMQTHRAKTT